MLRRKTVDLCRTNEIIVGQTVNRVRRISNRARPVLHRQDRMMALDNSDSGDSIVKTQAAIVGGEIESPHNIEAIVS